jgi:N-acetyldiaminopimelate deacetylase
MLPIELRHILHRNPEIAYQEVKTTELLINSIKSLKNADSLLKIYTPLPTGLLAEYKVNDGDYYLFRADIDALQIVEETDYEFKSENSRMHACGHDVHTSILYGLLKYVVENKIDKNILFMFQPAEESGGGAMKFFATGIFDSYNIKNAFALHVTDDYEKGTVASTAGVLFASALELDYDFRGVAAHVAFPQNGKNAFNALRLFLDAFEKLPREIHEPIILGVGKITAGDVRNISPGYARIEGSIRALSVESALETFDKVEAILQGIEKFTGVKCSVSKLVHYPEVVISAELFQKYSAILSAKHKFIDASYKMTGEDFGFISRKYPSFMFWLGTSTGSKYGLHNPKFLPDDSVIEDGISVFKEILLNL